MPDTTQPKPNPVPAILVYGTPSGPALTQASWFRAEDKEAVKAAAKELKFAVIELQTEADRALAAGAHEGVLKGSGRMIVGSVSAEVYQRIEEHARKGAGADPSKAETPRRSRRNPRRERARTPRPAGERRSADDETRVRTKHEHRCGSELAGTRAGHPGRAGDRQAGPRPRPRNPAGRREGAGRLLERETRIRGLLARHRQADRSRRIHPRVVRRPGLSAVQEPAPGHRRSASRVPRLGQVTARKSILRKLNGAACGSPLFISRTPESRLRPSHPQPQETKL